MGHPDKRYKREREKKQEKLKEKKEEQMSNYIKKK